MFIPHHKNKALRIGFTIKIKVSLFFFFFIIDLLDLNFIQTLWIGANQITPGIINI